MLRRQRSLMVLAAACAGVVAFVPAGRAATATFDNGGADGGLWTNNANWEPDGPVADADVKFDAAGSTTAAGTVTNVVDEDLSALTLHYRQFTTGAPGLFHTTQINHGKTLTLTGTTGVAGSVLYAGSSTVSGNTAPAGTEHSHTIIQDAPGAGAGGTLSIQSPTADIIVRQASASTAIHMATLDLSQLSHFNTHVRDVLVGAGDATYTRAMGTLTLARNTVIDANSIVVGSNTSGTTRNPSAKLNFGQNNAIHTGSITIGGRQTPDSIAGFNAGITNGTLVIRGPGGVGRADLNVAASPVNVVVGTTMDGCELTLDGSSRGFGSGSIDARLGTVTIGRAGFASNSTALARSTVGTFTYGAGVVDANTVVIGDDNGTTNAANGTGTINVRGTGQLIVNNSMTIGRKTGPGTGNGIGSLNLAGGSARVNGPVTDGGGSSTIAVTAGGTFQAQSLGSAASRIDTLSLDGGSVVVDVSAGLPSGAWGYVSSLNPTGTNTVGLNFAPGTLSAGQTIQAIDYTTLGGGGFGAFAMAKQPARVTAHLVNGASSIDIVIDSADSPKWNGTTGNNLWNTDAGNANWQLITAGTATSYMEDLATYSTTDSVLFNDDAAETNVNVAATVAPNAVVVNNATKSYVFSGAGKITGATGILKQGGGTLTIGNTGGNDFTGGIDIQAGSVQTGAANVLPDTGPIQVSGAGSFATAFDDAIGSLVVVGGNATIKGAHLTAGTVTVSSGSLGFAGGSITANIMNYSGGTISVGTGAINAGTLNLSNGVTLIPTPSVTASAINIDNATLGAGAIAPGEINVSTGGTIAAAVGGAATIEKNGTGTLTLSGNSTYTGVTTYNDGILRVTSANALGAAAAESNTILNNGGGTDGAGYMELSGDITVAEPLVMFGRRGFTPSNGGTGVMNKNPLIVNAAGNNTLTGGITMRTGGTNYAIESRAGKLTITGDVVNEVTGEALTRFVHLRGAGDGEITGGIKISGTQKHDIVKMDAGTWTLSGANGPIQKTTVEDGTLAFGGALYATDTLEVQANKNARVNAGGGAMRVLRANTLTLAAGAKLDLNDNKLITNNPVGTAGAVSGNTRIYDGLQGLVQKAKNGDAWDGPGLTSSKAATEGGLTTIGIANGAQAKGGIGATETALWGGQTITGSSILAMYTYAGDANLDGAITGDDYSAIDFGILFEGMDGYANGDFNYDGYVTGDDYSVIDLNILLQGPQIPTGGAVSASTSSAGLAGVTAVPEPSACGFALLGAAMALRRRRRTR